MGTPQAPIPIPQDLQLPRLAVVVGPLDQHVQEDVDRGALSVQNIRSRLPDRSIGFYSNREGRIESRLGIQKRLCIDMLQFVGH